MKKILMIVFSVALSLGAFAQKIAKTPRANVTHVPRQQITHSSRVHFYVAPAYYYGFDYGFPYYGYPSGFGYPHFPYRYRSMSKVLNNQVQSIKNEYSYKIKATRKDKSITKAERKQKILNLKAEREKDISIAEKNFRYQRMNLMNNQQGTNDKQNLAPDNSNSGSNSNQNSYN